MKVFAISDLHLSLCGAKPMEVFSGWDNYLALIKQSWLEQVGEEDIVLIAGDVSWAMRLEEFRTDLKFFEDLPGKKIFIRGNHDYWWESVSKVRAVLPSNIFALQNDSIKFDNVIIGGTRGWTIAERGQVLSEEDEVVLARELIRADLSLNQMQKTRQEGDICIFMMHFPPFDSQRIYEEFTNLFKKYNVDIVIYGHLHGKHIRTILKENRNGIDYYLTSTDQIGHQVIPIDTKISKNL